MLCVMITKETLTSKELGRALTEFEPEDPDHWEDISNIMKEHYDEQEIIEHVWEVYKQQIEG